MRPNKTPAVFLTRSALMALSFLGFLAAGCGGDGSHIAPFGGQVFVQGRPAVGASVTFYPISPTEPRRIPTAVVEADGSFRLTTVSAYDGAPAGDYVVCVIWSDSRREDGETLTGPDRLRWRYANPSASALKATVQAGKNPPARFDLN
jgi:hypothetical protein